MDLPIIVFVPNLSPVLLGLGAVFFNPMGAFVDYFGESAHGFGFVPL